MNPITLLWLRRDLRLHDHAALFHALEKNPPIQPLFIFDTDILADFANPHDRRLSFIAERLCQMDDALGKRGGGLLVLHGNAKKIIPKLVEALQAIHVFAAEDYEPQTRARDREVAQAVKNGGISFVKDQLIFSPDEILREGHAPYKVFTPYANAWRACFTSAHAAPYIIKDKGRYADYAQVVAQVKQHGFTPLDTSQGASAILEAIGYTYRADPLWPVKDAPAKLTNFMRNHAQAYPVQRNMVAEKGTSRLSPYIRFGLLSVRQCVAAAMEHNASVWLSELIWREFYAMNLYHFPDSAKNEWNQKYLRKLAWSNNTKHFKAWQEGKTGYPLVDAAMRQLLAEGWMHNRARMVVASFLTKHLRIDWRKGEAHFGQYLMDYDLASNIGGWQWAASTGTDAQPWFRIFNPILQSEKFDPNGDYIRRYVPELAGMSAADIHTPWKESLPKGYYPPIVEHARARIAALDMFKSVENS